MLTTVAVLVVSLAIAAPALSSFVRSNRVNSVQSELVSSLMLARSEAARIGARVGAQALAGGFSRGWRVWVDANNSGAFDVGEAVLREVPIRQGDVVIATAATAVVFNPNGFLVPVAPVNFDVHVSGGSTKHYCVLLQPVGLANVKESLSSCP